ncbi:hypothetical protein HF086_017264 [Spodoptera exigua]|uniref:C2H2-type domain-containing protein n=1 Tax=Spodoptera exigua TaxID=7107 RepID=A0A922S7J3_SPOEX|nr:hypothetical protein HF086_017264 [Spodoptera exigua]
MAEATNTVFIDVASSSQFVIADTTEEQKDVVVEELEEQPQQEVIVGQPRRIHCPECDRYTAETEEKMLRHIRKKHRGENPFQCYMCDYSTYNKILFEEHVSGMQENVLFKNISRTPLYNTRYRKGNEETRH